MRKVKEIREGDILIFSIEKEQFLNDTLHTVKNITKLFLNFSELLVFMDFSNFGLL